MCITTGLERTWGNTEAGRQWLADHHALKSAAASRWGLVVGPLFAGSNVSFVWEATRANGTPAVLKLNFPEAETEHEPDALRHWDGRGAVKVLDDDPAARALLLERLRPGESLESLDEGHAMVVACDILRGFRLPVPAGAPYRRLDQLARAWQDKLRQTRAMLQGGPRAQLLDHGVGRVDELVESAADSVVLHQDFHAGNILRDEHRGWLAIDPKPLVGDPVFDTASLLRDRRPELLTDPRPLRRMSRRLDQLVDELAYDRERIAGWGIVHALAWGVSSDGSFDHSLVDTARLILEAERPSREGGPRAAWPM